MVDHDGKEDTGEDYREEHDVGREVLREGREGKSELPDSKSSMDRRLL